MGLTSDEEDDESTPVIRWQQKYIKTFYASIKHFSAPLHPPWRRAPPLRHSTSPTVRQIIFWVRYSVSKKTEILQTNDMCHKC